jgi:HD domain
VSKVPPLPRSIAGITVPQDEVAGATWQWAQRSLPAYLLRHSVRSYCWGAAIAAGEGWAFDSQILWTAALMHDFGLTRIPRNTVCFEVEGAEIARAFLVGAGMDRRAADRAAIAIVDHMRAGVTLADGVESVLLDRATGLDVRGDGFDQVNRVRPGVLAEFPRGAFDRHFLRAIEREAAVRPGCESERLLRTNDLAGWMARSPWLGPAGT